MAAAGVTLRGAVAGLSQLAAHAVAGIFTVLVATFGAGALYAVLFLIAVVTNQPLGGPLALPGMLLGAFAGTAAAAIVLFLPITLLAKRLCGQRRLLQIPVATALFLAAAAVAMWRLELDVILIAVLAAILLLLLGVYWWALQSAAWLLRLAGRLLRLMLNRR